MIGHFEMHMPDADTRINGVKGIVVCHGFLSRLFSIRIYPGLDSEK